VGGDSTGKVVEEEEEEEEEVIESDGRRSQCGKGRRFVLR